MSTHLRHPPLYDASRAAAAAGAPTIPIRRVVRGTVVYRNVDAGRGADAARTVPPNQDSPGNRWTGRTTAAPGNSRGVGGLYVSTDVDALGGELFHYSLGMTLDEDLRRGSRPAGGGAAAPPRLTSAEVAARIPLRRLFAYALRYDVLAGDLSPHSAGGKRFLNAVWRAPAVQAAAAAAGYARLADAAEEDQIEPRPPGGDRRLGAHAADEHGRHGGRGSTWSSSAATAS